MSADAQVNLRGKRLVVFGCGYIGSEVARQAIASGLHVTALTRNEAKAIALRDEGIEVVVADLASETWHEQIAGGPEFVLNAVSSGGRGVEGYRQSYVEGLKSIAAWARRHDAAGTLVYTSSTSVYAEDGGVSVTEEAATGGDERTEILLKAETHVRDAEQAWARWFILRLAGIYGPGRHHLLNQVRLGEIAGRGEHRLNLAHRDDIVAAIWACFAAPASVQSQIFNVADDGAAPKAEIVNWLAQRAGVHQPKFTGVAHEGRRSITPDRVIANSKIKAVLGWRPQFPTFREGYENLLSL